MPFIDKSLEELRAYKPKRVEPADFDAFWSEVQRILKPNGVFSAWGYTWPSISPEIDKIFNEYVLKVIEPYWAPQNRLLWNHYKEVEFPFEQLNTPSFKMQVEWNLTQFFNFINTFSATRRCIDDNGSGFLEEAYSKFKGDWSDSFEKKFVGLDFVLYAGVLNT